LLTGECFPLTYLTGTEASPSSKVKEEIDTAVYGRITAHAREKILKEHLITALPKICMKLTQRDSPISERQLLVSLLGNDPMCRRHALPYLVEASDTDHDQLREAIVTTLKGAGKEALPFLLLPVVNDLTIERRTTVLTIVASLGKDARVAIPLLKREADWERGEMEQFLLTVTELLEQRGQPLVKTRVDRNSNEPGRP
jgi:hypothetical protein